MIITVTTRRCWDPANVMTFLVNIFMIGSWSIGEVYCCVRITMDLMLTITATFKFFVVVVVD